MSTSSDTPVWKPLRFFRPDPPYVPHDPDTFNVPTYDREAEEGVGTEAMPLVYIDDIIIGETVLAGYATSGAWAEGVVKWIEPGKYIEIDGFNANSLLWHGFAVLRGALADICRSRYAAREAREAANRDPIPAGYPLMRTDSGTSYGYTGFPDLEFWKRSGINPWLMVPSYEYMPGFHSQPSLVEQIEQLYIFVEEEGGAFTELEREAAETQRGELVSRAHYCGNPECEGDCGQLSCGCIDMCRGRCGWRWNEGGW
jgi:hypothetical protein